MKILVNSNIIEIYNKESNNSSLFVHWKSKAIKIYDASKRVSEEEKYKIIQYLYDEGLIEDRRIECQIITEEES